VGGGGRERKKRDEKEGGSVRECVRERGQEKAGVARKGDKEIRRTHTHAHHSQRHVDRALSIGCAAGAIVLPADGVQASQLKTTTD
jgi:hypothetical protein